MPPTKRTLYGSAKPLHAKGNSEGYTPSTTSFSHPSHSTGPLHLSSTRCSKEGVRAAAGCGRKGGRCSVAKAAEERTIRVVITWKKADTPNSGAPLSGICQAASRAGRDPLRLSPVANDAVYGSSNVETKGQYTTLLVQSRAPPTNNSRMRTALLGSPNTTAVWFQYCASSSQDAMPITRISPTEAWYGAGGSFQRAMME
mmetsp:Transcript_17273/g.35344  ORF Transcript_17273/g.35344 Transcript_17273/m.35344 type:complete len:200 (-) Transcript_17273:207-806(-)